jgi:hypothetical protein
MRNPVSWAVLAAGCLVLAAPPVDAKSSSRSVGVQIIMPPRPSSSSDASAAPWEEALEPPTEAGTPAASLGEAKRAGVAEGSAEERSSRPTEPGHPAKLGGRGSPAAEGGGTSRTTAPAPALQRTTTVIFEGSGTDVLVTDAPLL